jgi:hypothetical protein
LTPQKIRDDLNLHIQKLIDLGFKVTLYYFDPNDQSSFDQFGHDLTTQNFLVVEVGAGMRKLDVHLACFEKVVNMVREKSPSSKICFNSNPADTADAVLRVLNH